MSYRIPSWLAVCTLAAALCACPSQGQAGVFDWMCPSSWGSAPSTTTYAPPYSAQRIVASPVSTGVTAMTGCTPQTCSYTPQTTYRWSYSRMAYTSYQPVLVRDPCTGCASTALQPVARQTLLPWLHRKPVTSYQLACSPVCNTCPTSYNSYAAGCDSCGTIGTTSSVIGSGCTTCGPVSNSVAPDPGYAPPTYKNQTNGASGEGTQDRLQMKPSEDPNSDAAPNEQEAASNQTPRLISPQSQTTARPIRPVNGYYPISLSRAGGQSTQPAGSVRSRPPIDVSGWHTPVQ